MSRGQCGLTSAAKSFRGAWRTQRLSVQEGTDLHRGQIIAQLNHVSLLPAADVTLSVVTGPLTVSMGVLLFGMHQIRKEGS